MLLKGTAGTGSFTIRHERADGTIVRASTPVKCFKRADYQAKYTLAVDPAFGDSNVHGMRCRYTSGFAFGDFGDWHAGDIIREV